MGGLLLARPEEVVPRVLGWITEDTEVAGLLDVDAAIACVKPARAAEVEMTRDGVDDAAREVSDDGCRSGC